MERDQIIKGLDALRKSIIHSLFVVGSFSFVSFLFSKKILQILLKAVTIKVYYFTLPEVFFSMIELSIMSGIFFSIPVIFFFLWRNFKGIIAFNFRYVFLASILFYLGTIFCYLFVLKSGVAFLLGYASEKLRPVISVEKFVIFSCAMIFAFGATFETPLFLLFLSRARIVSYEWLAKRRRHAILFITIFAAVITPTPDVYNMMLLAVPTYLLYEFGLIMIKIDELRRKKGGIK